MDRLQRFSLILSALEEAAPAHDQASARLLLEETMNRIENAYSGVPCDPANWMKDGRLYPPHDDQEKISPIPGASLYFSLKHRIWFGNNGAIRIERRLSPKVGMIELDKAGSDGALCPKPE